MRTNRTKTKEKVTTHEGAKGVKGTLEDQLRRSVMNCLLWEKQYYENGVAIAERIRDLVFKLGASQPEKVYQIAVEARQEQHLRHVPLFIAACMSNAQLDSKWVRNAVRDVIKRPDEIAEIISLFWEVSNKSCKCPRAIRLGIQDVINSRRFKEYHYAKYKGSRNTLTLRDAIRIARPKPISDDVSLLMHKIVNGELEVPDTWETQLSAGGDKCAVFERLLRQKKLGGLALLRNLRNMQEAKVDQALLESSIAEHNFDRVLPFRFISAAKYAPRLEPYLEKAMLKSLEGMDKLPGRTALLVDISGSMFYHHVSARSELLRADAAFALSILLEGVCDNLQAFTFSTNVVEVPPRKGFALRDTMSSSQRHGGTQLGHAVDKLRRQGGYDRLIVITDEQAHDNPTTSALKGTQEYMINVASSKNGVATGAGWAKISGWSEAVVKWVLAYEANRC